MYNFKINDDSETYTEVVNILSYNKIIKGVSLCLNYSVIFSLFFYVLVF